MENSILDTYREKYNCYDQFKNKMELLLNEIILHSNIKISSITSRCKSFESLREKIQRKDYSDIQQITDLVGLRIITFYSDDVDKLAEIIEKEFVIDKINSVDKRLDLDVDRFGYLSLHFVISLPEKRSSLLEYSDFLNLKAELQIRSILQHAWCEIEHDSGYKGGNEIPREVKRDFFRLAGLLEVADKEFLGIRENLKDYSAKVSEIIATKPDEVLIDAVSLRKFIETNKELQIINQTIADYDKGWIEQSPDNQIIRCANELSYVGLKTIEDIENNLKKFKDDVLAFAFKLISVKEDNIFDRSMRDTIGIFYLCYIILGVNFSVAGIVEYLNDADIGEDSEIGREDFAEEIIEFCRTRGLI